MIVLEHVDPAGQIRREPPKHGEVVKVLDLVMTAQIGQQACEPGRGNDRELAGRQSVRSVVVGQALERGALVAETAVNLEPERYVERAVRTPAVSRVPLQQHVAFCRPLALAVGIGAQAPIVAAIDWAWRGGVSGQKRPRSGEIVGGEA